MAGKPKKLTPEDVLVIRRWWQIKRATPSRREMCELFGINQTTLTNTARGLIHKTVL